MATVTLKPGHVQPVWAGHPWVYAQAIDRVEGGPTAGDWVEVRDPRGNFLGAGFYSPRSAIPVRVIARQEGLRVDRDFLEARITHARDVRHRAGLGEGATTGYRLVHAEGDGLPGIIVDRFDDVLVVQLLTFGMKTREDLVLGALERVMKPRAIIDRTPISTAKNEGFEPASGIVRGAQDVPSLRFKERDLSYELPLDLGQKTGFYFDQRGLRARVEELSRGKRVLDAYGYVGSFSMAAARGGASESVCIDESAIALEVGAMCARANGLADRIRFEKNDARRALADAHAAFDVTIVDPPRLAPTRSARDKALVAYAKLAELACRATKSGGLVVLCSCSAAIDLASLTRSLATGALRANVQAMVTERHFQGADHPVSAAFGEGLYLSSLIARVEPR